MTTKAKTVSKTRGKSIRKAPVSRKPTELPDEDISDVIARYNGVFDEAKGEIVNRSEEIGVMKLAIAAGEHVLIEGKHGLAKSQMVSEVVDRIEDAGIFRKQLNKHTDADEVLGPVFADRYRNDAVFVRNADHRLPKSHFAFLDEMFRADESLLETLMSILNERHWENGHQREDCPLMSAFATCNFTINTEEMDAFVDRFAFRIEVQPLQDSKHQATMLSKYLARLRLTSPKGKATISLSDVQRIRLAVDQVDFDRSEMSLYIAVIKRFCDLTREKLFVSDRRKCVALKTLAAHKLLNGGGSLLTETGALMWLKYNFVTPGDKEIEDLFDTALTKELSEIENLRKDQKTLEKIRLFSTKLTTWREKLEAGKMAVSRMTESSAHVREGVQLFSSLAKDNSRIRSAEAREEVSQAIRQANEYIDLAEKQLQLS